MGALTELLVDELDRDLASRRRELIDLRLMAASAKGARASTLARACHVMAYAHWEGFVKKALRMYLEHLVRLQISLNSLQYELQALAMVSRIKAASNPERSVVYAAALLKTIDARQSETFTIDAGETVRIGNLTSENLRTLLSCAGLPYLAGYATRENFLDSVVCGRRHRIAHGDWQPVSSTEAREVVNDVLIMCVDINDQIQTAALYQEYLLSP